jgi:hypothetical protein
MEPSRDELKKSIDVKKPKKPPPPAKSASSGNRPTSWWLRLFGRPGIQLPLFHRTRKRPNGDVEETMWGPSAVQAIRWMVVLVLGLILILKNPALADALIRWIR